jgi:hypothetical protein
MVHLLQVQQKNMMEQIGQQVISLNTARAIQLGGCGTQTAALAFGESFCNRRI